MRPDPAPPGRSVEEMTEVALRHLDRLRRRQARTVVAIGLAVVLAAVTLPLVLLAEPSDVRNIAPIGTSAPVGTDDAGATASDARVERSSAPPSPAVGRGPGRIATDAGALNGQVGASAGRIAFATYRHDADAAEIYVTASGTSGAIRITEDDSHDSQPTWSPDGSSIAYTSEADDYDLRVVDVQTRTVVRLTDTRDEGELSPSWSPDGRRIVFTGFTYNDTSGSRDLYVIDVATRGITRFTETPGFDEDAPSWSPDGRNILFSRTDRYGSGSAPGLFVVRSDGTRLRRLTSGRDHGAAWSPDGARIAFARVGNLGGPAPGRISTTPVDASSIYTIAADGSALTRLTFDDSVLDERPSWAPDGARIVFTRDPDGARNPTLHWAGTPEGGPLTYLYLVGSDGSGVRPLSTETADFDPSWSLEG